MSLQVRKHRVVFMFLQENNFFQHSAHRKHGFIWLIMSKAVNKGRFMLEKPDFFTIKMRNNISNMFKEIEQIKLEIQINYR